MASNGRSYSFQADSSAAASSQATKATNKKKQFLDFTNSKDVKSNATRVSILDLFKTRNSQDSGPLIPSIHIHASFSLGHPTGSGSGASP